ncbi:DUF5132 domain-containing protein [Fischerella thermalis]|jgi:hypothetical protein|uniref:DUF5132 domain-containing protein n=1 Tax=Fischerella thermalis JSC-11 TaxID=741277 RepID=G6FMN3_9CYAN|nr:DUF5132 domain-containing protein [Fischerella thermalis]PLZ79773.1 DUF5132 domain-containing protein [Fischerella thermalis WC217]PLZ99015.1 DUF5132 domain-containing protein [Fischerella thermalis CCMEE 5196]PMB03020.1 DUF5132 domain-containing protein [Fischerella thermalis CCMEE 5328]PMB07850.1 DUF5132 domain-containing protein [Fischerella thermalis CCMEE 5273]PMB47700.1 DUF5132 domain-containing protein [Fischerella thermalis CCMEE 5205]
MAPKIIDFVEDAGAPGIIAGIGAVILAPVVIPVVAGVGKPIAKSLIKGGLVLYEKSKGAFAELGETWEDMVAEARAELAESKQLPAVETADNISDNGA